MSHRLKCFVLVLLACPIANGFAGEQASLSSGKTEKVVGASTSVSSTKLVKDTPNPISLAKKRVLMHLSGQLNFVGFYADDGSKRSVYWGSNASTYHRLNLDTVLPEKSGWRVGSRIQFGLKVNDSSAISQLSESVDTVIDVRRAEVYLSNKGWGTFTIGKGETASCDAGFVDFSGTDVLSESSIDDVGGGLYFRQTTGQLSSIQVSNVINNLDTFFRRNRLRYDSPALNGLSVSLSTIEGARNDVALRYEWQFDQAKIGVHLAYANGQTIHISGKDDRANGLHGSASVLLDNGLNLTLAGAKLMVSHRPTREKPFYYSIKPGYQMNNAIGKTSFAIDYSRYQHINQSSDRSTSYGLSVVQHIADWHMDVYGGYRAFRLKREGQTFEPIHIASLGVRYQF